jgi:flagellar biosynthesis regulator FlbT
MDPVERRNDLLLAASFANTLARLVANFDDPEICDEHLLLELLALADRAEEALAQPRA